MSVFFEKGAHILKIHIIGTFLAAFSFLRHYHKPICRIITSELGMEFMNSKNSGPVCYDRIAVLSHFFFKGLCSRPGEINIPSFSCHVSLPLGALCCVEPATWGSSLRGACHLGFFAALSLPPRVLLYDLSAVFEDTVFRNYSADAGCRIDL